MAAQPLRAFVFFAGLSEAGAAAVVRACDASASSPRIVLNPVALPGGGIIDGLERRRGNLELCDAALEFLIVGPNVSALETTAVVTYALFTQQCATLCLGSAPSGAVDALGSPAVKNHPLLRICSSDTCESECVERFLTFPAQPGRIFVVEGGDGAGKETQVAMLCRRLKAEGYPAATLDYPHDRARYGVLIRELLSGKMGSLKDVNPLMFASLYGLNRHDTRGLLQHWLARGCNVVLDRYMTANFGHQASKYENREERNGAIMTLHRFETVWLGLPAAYRVLYLNLPPECALRALMADTTRRELDMHEKAGIDYKNRVRAAFLWCCSEFPEWAEVPCMEAVDTENERRFTREEVHETMWQQWSGDFVNKGLGESDAPQ